MTQIAHFIDDKVQDDVFKDVMQKRPKSRIKDEMQEEASRTIIAVRITTGEILVDNRTELYWANSTNPYAVPENKNVGHM